MKIPKSCPHFYNLVPIYAEASSSRPQYPHLNQAEEMLVIFVLKNINSFKEIHMQN